MWNLCLESCDTFVALTPSVQSVSKSDSLSRTQTVCPMHILLACESRVWKSVSCEPCPAHSMSQSRTACIEVRQFVSCTSCKHVKVVSCVLWYFWCLDSFCTLCLNIRQSSLKSDRLVWNRTVCPVLTIVLQLWYHRYVCTRASMSAYIVVSWFLQY